jgi:lactate permease
MHTTIKVLIALLPFVALVACFLVFRMSALQAALWTCLVEFAAVLVYYQHSVSRSIEASLWGNLTMWSVFLLLWSGQIFGHSFRATGLIQVLLDSVGGIFPAGHKQGRALAMIALLSGFIGTFNLYAVYPVAIPGLAELGFDPVEAAAGYLIYASWCIPFAGLFIGAVIASAATHVPVTEIAHTAGLLTIPIVFVSTFGAFRVLKFRFFDRESQTLFWVLTLSNVAGLVLFTQVWPEYHDLTLMSGAAILLVFLLVYGRAKKKAVRAAVPVAAALDRSSAQPTAAGNSADSLSWSRMAKGYAPLLVAILYVVLIRIPAIARPLARLSFSVSAWGFSGVHINVLTTPAFPIFVAVVSCYFFRLKPSSLLKDFLRGTRHGSSSLLTLLFGSATVYLMLDTGQIGFLGGIVSSGGRAAYQLLDSGLIFLGGMTFGQGAPAVFLFSRMQMSPAAALGLPLALLVGLVNLVAMGPTNAIKPPLIRFAASLVNTNRDRDIFLKGLYWGAVQIVATTIFLLFLVLVWK